MNNSKFYQIFPKKVTGLFDVELVAGRRYNGFKMISYIVIVDNRISILIGECNKSSNDGFIA